MLHRSLLPRLVNGSKILSGQFRIDRMKFSNISYGIATPSEFPKIHDFLYQNFHMDEPISKALKLIPDANTRVADLDNTITHWLAQNMTLVATDKETKEMMGVCINIQSTREVEEESSDATSDFKHVMELLKRVHGVAGDVFAKYETDAFFEIKIVTTNRLKRQGGLGTDLLKRSEKLADALGFTALKAEATGEYSKKAFKKLGYEIAAEYNYADYDSAEGVKVLRAMEAPHQSLTLMIKPKKEEL